METCANCKHGIFDETLGEWKCAVKKRYVSIMQNKYTCKDFKKKG